MCEDGHCPDRGTTEWIAGERIARAEEKERHERAPFDAGSVFLFIFLPGAALRLVWRGFAKR